MKYVWYALEWPIGFASFALAWLVKSTSRVTIEGNEPEGAAVFVNWHRYQSFLIPFHGSRRRWMLVSPSPRLEPVARFCKLAGLRLVRGASGERGQEARERLKDLLRSGESVVLAVDGPAGPRYQAKRGCVDLAKATGVPIVPVMFRARPAHEFLWRWDHSLFPLPFARITIVYGKAIAPTGSDEEILAAVERDLNALSS